MVEVKGAVSVPAASSLEDRPEVDHAALARIKAAMKRSVREIVVRRTRTGHYEVLVLVPAPSDENASSVLG